MNDTFSRVLSPKRYALSAIILHWSIAALLLFQVSLGWRLEDLPKGTASFAGYQFHKSVGFLILALSLARLGVRLVARRPAPAEGAPAVKLLVKVVHVLLYAVMIVGPLSGWIMVSTSKIRMQTMVFGKLPMPNLPVGHAWHEPAETIHGALGLVTLGLFALHVAGALRHHFMGDDLLGRMIPANTRRGLTIGVVVALICSAGAMALAKVWPFGGPAVAPVAAASADPDGDESEAATDMASDAAVQAPASAAAPVADASAGTETAAKAVAWQLAPGGKLGFHATYSGDAINGSFGRWDAKIVFSPDDLAHSTLRATIDLASVGTGDAQRDDMLKGDNFFRAAAHPQAIYTASRFRAQSPGHYVAEGTLSLAGKIRPVPLAFVLTIDGDRATAHGTATLSRTAFGVGTGEWGGTDTLLDGVTVDFALKAKRQS
ncbi:cytochrome B [Novosphingobium sp. AAP1]|uniref:cytochrome b/b6 domain-containing protein n=1 Tax=Novosphingobium sp. AAP1 TaxID=1523413 RepID=UPI0006B9BDAB|nr:cytochrome b/b6 domain-containing protein [Novosphingobium sp. AAP1]KPF55487.1 cytochrome B [Novosphingobium sp. AAP1]